MDELELLAKYPLGTEITFQDPFSGGMARGPVNGAAIATDDDQSYVPVYVKRTDKTVYVNTKNIVEVS
jgi:hypothetical protein